MKRIGHLQTNRNYIIFRFFTGVASSSIEQNCFTYIRKTVLETYRFKENSNSTKIILKLFISILYNITNILL